MTLDSSVNATMRQDSDLPHLLSEYRIALDHRYPMVCATCAPVVEDILQEREYKARNIAFGNRLKEQNDDKRSKHHAEMVEKRVLTAMGESWIYWLAGILWKIRGLLWASSISLSTLLCILGMSLFPFRSQLAITQHRSGTISPVLLLSSLSQHHADLMLYSTSISFLWAFWNPNWNRIRKAKSRGKSVKASRSSWIKLQMALFLLRLSLSAILSFDLALEIETIRTIFLLSLLLIIIVS